MTTILFKDDKFSIDGVEVINVELALEGTPSRLIRDGDTFPLPENLSYEVEEMPSITIMGQLGQHGYSGNKVIRLTLKNEQSKWIVESGGNKKELDPTADRDLINLLDSKKGKKYSYGSGKWYHDEELKNETPEENEKRLTSFLQCLRKQSSSIDDNDYSLYQATENGIIGTHIKSNETSEGGVDEEEELKNAVENLLAVMHGDGGHYTEKRGIIKSVKDAQQLIHKKWVTVGHLSDINDHNDKISDLEAQLVKAKEMLVVCKDVLISVGYYNNARKIESFLSTNEVKE